MRLLVFAPYFPPHVGGLEGYVADLHDALLERDDLRGITVLAPRIPEAPAREARGARYLILRYPAVELVPNFPLPGFWRREFWRMLAQARSGGVDAVVGHTRFFISSAFALVCARRLRVPLVHVEHGSDFVQFTERGPRLAARVYDLTIGRWLLRRADAVVAISKAAAAFVERLSGRGATVVYRGMRVSEIDAAAPDQELRERAAGRVVVAFAGRLIDGKGLEDLLEAFARLPRSQLLLCIVGDGPRRAGLEALAQRLGLGGDVLFTGYVEESRAWSLVRAADIVVNPSYTEGLPTSVLEAALLGRAIVASNVGGTPEIVQDGVSALLYPARDVEALIGCLRQLLEQPQRRSELGAAAREEAASRFVWSASAARFAALVRELVARRGGQAAGAATAPSTSANSDS